jgi:hypothetical protein
MCGGSISTDSFLRITAIRPHYCIVFSLDLFAAGPAGFYCTGQQSSPVRKSMPTCRCMDFLTEQCLGYTAGCLPLDDAISLSDRVSVSVRSARAFGCTLMCVRVRVRALVMQMAPYAMAVQDRIATSPWM